MDEFDKLFPGLSEKIFEQFYGDYDHGFDIYDKQSLDREGGNFSFKVSCDFNDCHVAASCQDGNWNGSEIIDFEYDTIISDGLNSCEEPRKIKVNKRWCSDAAGLSSVKECGMDF